MTEKWYRLAVDIHRKYGGKISVMPKVPIRSLEDFAIYYTPGIAEVSRQISINQELAFELTSRWNIVGVITDGTRVLGLGNIGPEAAYPVMEGKALIFKYLGGVDAIPIPIRVKTPDEFIFVAKALEPALGGINLEDIESPKCFYLLDKLREELKIPVWHDDQQGTATATLAALINALKLVGKKISDVTIALIGAGASNIYTARILIKYGAKPGNLILVDSRGILHPEREDIDKMMIENPWKYKYAIETNAERRKGGIPEAIKGVDVVIAASRPGPGVIKKEWIATMNKDAIVFALANPVPEIWPWEAKEAGARIVATGRSDFPNQVNNSLIFPAVFRGALDVRATTITDEMLIAAAEEVAKYAEERGISEDYIIPKMTEWEVYVREAAAVAAMASAQKVARIPRSYKEELEIARSIIERSIKTVEILMKERIID
ncbi:Malate dehydrogenase (oxaloacetate-decarboxylating) [Pyrobaculum islandicum DSM 4184]|uniref:Malate dehydrogenase (Oxaloacetate-decarboxylating) n=1 Tax=Pyrobaculum islandicum (strain DSM 4184 / JCM 9189 / GEO3) TaxID=384616 RepID=A1RV60_PYRIL|nr:NADP-dependent malic enzyme [Pyrobaculum islandicum]ABL88842.1 Malate dehydrogenase (oxaloacetate-decarboxylating) [Pyrobaculum islandicum DSM 4184]